MSKYKVERILNIPVDVMTMEDVKQDLVSNEAIGDKLTLTSVNPQIVLMAEENDTVKTFIENSTHRIADGIGLVKVSGWTKGDIKERVTGFDLMQEVLSYADEHHKNVFLYGSKPEVVAQAATNIETDYPELNLVGWIDGYTKLSDKEIVQRMNEKEADIVFVALGSPRQEEWLSRNMDQLTATIFQTIGGCLDVLSGATKRAPDIFIKLNLEWLYRSVSNPKRLYRIFQLPVFVAKSLSWHRKNGKH